MNVTTLTRSAALATVLLAGSALGVTGADDRAPTDEQGLVVETTAGSVRGLDTGEGQEWRGIPFAAPPTGDLRWRPPAPVAAWEGIRDATEFAPVCPQLAWDDETQSEYVDGSEDCLYLNVFAPPTSTGPLPVMVNLHGGGNYGFWPRRDASAFTDRGIVVVTPAYRLGVFGWNAHPALSVENGGTSGEQGILDQLAALEWVRDNIAAFGGDPDNVTLTGESAGSFDAMQLVLSPMARGLIDRAALQTTAFWYLRGDVTLAEEERAGMELASLTGCTNADAYLACMRAKPAADIVTAAGPGDIVPMVGGAVLPDAPIRLLEGGWDPIPLIVGSNREERSSWFEPVHTGEPYDVADYEADTDNLEDNQVPGDRIRELYPVSDYDSPMWATVAALTDYTWGCPAREVALASQGPVWRYLYTHRLDNHPDLAKLRAAHFLDEPILWNDGSLLFGLDYEFDPSDEYVADVMATYWANFATTGDPNGPGVPQWPAFSTATEVAMVLDDPVSTVEGWHTDQCEALMEQLTK